MKKKYLTLVLLVLFAASLSANIYFKNYFPAIPKWSGKVREAPDKFGNSGILVAQKKYLHEKRDRWIYVSYEMGSGAFKKCPLPLGYRFVQGNISVILVKKVQGFLMFYTYKPMQREGKVTVFIPADRRQKIHGSVSFSFHNVKKDVADRFMKHFDFRKIKRKMEELK